MSDKYPFTNWPSLAPYAKKLPLPGGELFYYDSEGNFDFEREAGTDVSEKQTIVLIHGLGDEADTWRHIFHPLVDEGYRVIAPDLPGFGRSHWKGKIKLQNHCETVLRLMKAAGAVSEKNPAIIAGSSLGAGIAQLVAGKHPKLVNKLILLDGCFPFAGIPAAGLIFLSMPFLGKNWYRGFRKKPGAAWISLYPYYFDLDAMSDEDKSFLLERVKARVQSPNQEHGYFSTLRSMITFHLFGYRAAARKTENFPGKIACFWGENDNIFPKEKTAPFRLLHPDAQFFVITGAGHLPAQEKPVKTAQKIIQFLRAK